MLALSLTNTALILCALKSLMSDIWIFPSIMLAIAFLFTDCFIAQRYEDVVAENTALREGPHKNATFQALYRLPRTAQFSFLYPTFCALAQ